MHSRMRHAISQTLLPAPLRIPLQASIPELLTLLPSECSGVLVLHPASACVGVSDRVGGQG